MSEDRFNLERFVRRQEEDYDRAYKELSEGSNMMETCAKAK